MKPVEIDGETICGRFRAYKGGLGGTTDAPGKVILQTGTYTLKKKHEAIEIKVSTSYNMKVTTTFSEVEYNDPKVVTAYLWLLDDSQL
jgi:hypothetical protein